MTEKIDLDGLPEKFQGRWYNWGAQIDALQAALTLAMLAMEVSKAAQFQSATREHGDAKLALDYLEHRTAYIALSNALTRIREMGDGTQRDEIEAGEGPNH